MATIDEFLLQYEPKKQTSASEQFLEPYVRERQGLLGNIGSDLGQRSENVGSEIMSTLTGQKPLVNLPFRYAGEVGGGAYDVLGNIGSAVTPDIIEEPVKRVLGDIAGYVSNTAPAQAIKQAYGYVPEDIQDTLEGGLSLAGLPPTGRALSAAEKAVNIKKIYPTIEEVAKASTDLYTKAKQLGADYNPNMLKQLYSEAQKGLPKDKVSKSLINLDEADKFTLKLKSQLGESPTLDTFESIDKYLGDKATDAYDATPALSRKFTKLQAALRESATNPDNIVGSPEGILAHREATRLWGIKKKMDDIELAIRKGGRRGKTGIQTQFRRIDEDDSLLRGYSDVEKKAIRVAAETGRLDDVLNVFGSRLISIGSTLTGTPAGVALGYVAPAMSRAGAEAIKTNQGGKVMKALGERSGLVKEERRISPSGILGKLKQEQQ